MKHQPTAAIEDNVIEDKPKLEEILAANKNTVPELKPKLYSTSLNKERQC